MPPPLESVGVMFADIQGFSHNTVQWIDVSRYLST